MPVVGTNEIHALHYTVSSGYHALKFCLFVILHVYMHQFAALTCLLFAVFLYVISCILAFTVLKVHAICMFVSLLHWTRDLLRDFYCSNEIMYFRKVLSGLKKLKNPQLPNDICSTML